MKSKPNLSKHQIILNTMQPNSLASKIESVLFYKAEPMKIKNLAQILGVDENQISEAIQILSNDLQGRGLRVISKDDAVVLVTSPDNSDIIKNLQKEELSKNLSKAALETLSIVIYKGPIRRSEIDYIRGVNSQFSLRLLLVRGLIEKISDPNDERSYLYKPSFELFAHLGIQKIEDIPDFAKVVAEIESFKNQNTDNVTNESK